MSGKNSSQVESGPPVGGAECACGLPGGHCVCALVAFIEYLKWRTRHKRDVLILFTGPTGEGKSTVAWWIFHMADPGFNWSRMPLAQETFLRVLLHDDRTKGDAVVLDEGQDGAEARQSMSKKNRPLNEFAEVCRAQCLMLGVAKPNIRWIDSKLKDDKALFWIHVPEQGWAMLHEASRPGVGYKGPAMRIDPEADYTEWVPIMHFQFPDPSSFTDWQRYESAKMRHVKAFEVEIPG
jgi:hypothetical protein